VADKTPNPNSMAARIAAATASGAAVVQSKTEPTPIRVPLDLLDDNPYQPRSAMDESKIRELAASISSNGLLQPIAVKRDGERWVIIAGHRRTQAYRRLRDSEAGTERSRWAEIPALELAGVDAVRLATLAYVENEQRENLSVLDTANAINRMFEDGLYESVEQAAAELGKSVTRVKDLRRIARAPAIIKQSLGAGVRLTVGVNEDGAERVEVRRLELAHGLAFISIHEHLAKAGVSAKKADARVEAAIRRALASQWSSKRTEEYARDVIKGRDALPEEADGPIEAPPVFTDAPTRFVIDKRRLGSATVEQRAALKAAFEALLQPSQPLA
jgi:ParB/RepB/Spo0J family partition protein